jgi:hypothetical protein
MTRTKILLLSVAVSFAATLGTPALALNPQPLPPGHAAPTHIFASAGNHRHR